MDQRKVWSKVPGSETGNPDSSWRNRRKFSARPEKEKVSALLSGLYNQKCDCCGGIIPGHTSLSAPSPSSPNFKKNIYTKALRHLHKTGKYESEMLKDEPFLGVVKETNRVLAAGMSSGLADNVPPAAMVNALENDVFVFSGFKTHTQLKEASELLLNSDGTIKSYAVFKADVQSIYEAYNNLYLEAEYIFATGSAEMAAKWADLEKGSDRYNLQYRTAEDGKVREWHQAMAGTTLPDTDPFWNNYYPPNGWRCRCTAVQVRIGKYPESDSQKAIAAGEKATTRIDKKGNNADEIFRFNPGKQKVIFPPKHPYRQVQEKVKKIVEGLNSSIINKNTASSELVTWYKENLPVKKVGKFEARRFEVNRSDLDSPIIVNKVFYNEIRGKYKDDKHYLEKLELSKQAHTFIKNADFKGDETPIHSHADKFKAYEYSHNGTIIEFKCKVNNDGIFLYYMRLK